MYGEQYEENVYWRQGEKGQLIQLIQHDIKKIKRWKIWHEMRCGIKETSLPPPPPTPALIFSHLTATDVNIAA